MAIMPGSYRQLLMQTEGCVGGPELIDLINQFRLDKIFLPSLATFNYIIDCAGGKYLHLSSLYDEILGYKKEIISDKGPKFFAILCHPHDYKIYNDQIFPKIVCALKSQCFSTYPGFYFTFNYRVTTKYGSCVSLVQRSTFIITPDRRVPLVEAGIVSDISNYKEDTRIFYKAEQINKRDTSLLSASVHFPDQVCSLLSTRELEILRCIYAGMSSKKIADKYSISINTIHNHRKNMLLKTGTPNTGGLLRFSHQNGLL